MTNNSVTHLRRDRRYQFESEAQFQDDAPTGAEMILAYAFASLSGAVVTFVGCWLYWHVLGAACG